jgi:hypothetical protein
MEIYYLYYFLTANGYRNNLRQLFSILIYLKPPNYCLKRNLSKYRLLLKNIYNTNQIYQRRFLKK